MTFDTELSVCTVMHTAYFHTNETALLLAFLNCVETELPKKPLSPLKQTMFHTDALLTEYIC